MYYSDVARTHICMELAKRRLERRAEVRTGQPDVRQSGGRRIAVLACRDSWIVR